MIESIRKQILRFPTQLLLLSIGALLFIPFIGGVHLFDWDEINFAESAREMLLTHNFRMVQINFEPFYEKPPLFIWLQALSMSYFGVNEFAARLPNAICGILTMLVVFNVGRNVFKSQLGVLWALLFACSILPQVYFKSGIIDPIFNLFTFLGIFFMYRLSIQNDFEDEKTTQRGRRMNLLLSALCIGLATLTKGPAAILITVLTASVYFFLNRGKLKIELSEMIIWWMILSLVVILWLSFEIRANTRLNEPFGQSIKFVVEFIRYQVRLFTTPDAGHGGPFYYHFLVLFIGVFPASALIVDAFKKNDHDDSSQIFFKRWMTYLLVVVLVIFSIVKTKIIHYSSLCYFPITFLAAYYLNHLFDKKIKWTWRQTVPLLVTAGLLTIALTAGIFLIQQPEAWTKYIKDDFARECLKAKVYWSDSDIRFGFALLVCMTGALVLIRSHHVKWGVYLILVSSALFVNTMMTFVVPRVEKYSQAALVDFLVSKQDENCQIETAGFKSYAHYFYGNKRPPNLPNERNNLPSGLKSDSLKMFYVITKVNKAEEVRRDISGLTELYRKNGWVFFKKQ